MHLVLLQNKKKHNTFTSILHALLMSKKKDKCFIIWNTLEKENIWEQMIVEFF